MNGIFLIPDQFRIVEYVDHIWAFIIGYIICMAIVYLVHQVVDLVDKYNRTKPIYIKEADGREIIIPADKFQQMPAVVVRDLFKRPAISRSQNVVEEEVVDEKTDPINLPVIREGHVLIAGETRSGKTTAMKAVLSQRENVTVLDPHNDSATWPSGMKVIGGGRKFEDISDFLNTMQSEFDSRFEQRARGRKQFSGLTIATDELPAIIAELGKDYGIIWRRWLREGWKVGLYIVVCTQSTRVETLGIKGEGDILQNFAYVITLGKLAQSQYKDLTDGLDRPAVISSVDGTYPVVIPHTEYNMQSLYADVDNLLESDKERIVTLYLSQPENNKNLAAIQQQIFNYSGGKAFYKVKDVLEERGLL